MQKTNNINNQAKSYLAKLLATENISVEHKKVQTAYFDVKSRLLVLPIWKHMNNDITDLLISHEVGHALFTPQSGWEKSVIEKKIPKSFLNVIEDARIEKLIKRKYPGLSQSFIKGYRDLIRNDFFGTKDKDINELLLIDRLNIHFKSSHVESPVIFKDEYEQDVVSRMNKLETFDDVVKLAEELSKYCKKESEEKEQEMESLTSVNGDYDGEEDDEMRDGDDSSDDNQDQDDNEEEENNSSNDSAEDGDEEENQEQEENANTDEPPSGEQSDKELKGAAAKPAEVPEEVSAETDQSWESKKGDLLDPKSKNNEYMNVHNFKNTKDYVVDYKQVLQDFNEVMKPNPDRPRKSEAILRLVSEYRKFVKEQSKKVSYMVKEYEMKKAAAAYSRTKQDKSGIIDPLKLHSYKYNDDIFKRMAITPNGKNHGMMMFIDWSGSMHDKITNTVHQLMNLTMFCKKVNIPFEVYAFGNDGYKNSQDTRLPQYQEGDITIDNRFNLFNYLSSRMNAKEYENGMINLFMLAEKYNPKYSISRRAYRTLPWDQIEELRSGFNWLGDLPREPWGYGMCSTPLNDAIMASMPMVTAFRKKYGIDKMNTVFLTDGSSDGNYDKVTSEKPEHSWATEIGNGMYRVSPNWDSNLVLRDTVTKKEYFDVGRIQLTESLLDALRQRTGTKVLGFYISSGKKIDRYTLDHYFPDYAYEKGQKVYDRKKVMAEYRKNKCLIVKDNIGYDEFYLLAGGEMQISDGQMATPSENAKKSELKRLFASTLKSNRDSRIVLNKFIEQVA